MFDDRVEGESGWVLQAVEEGGLEELEPVVEFGCLKVVNQMSYLTVGSLENTSRLVDVSLNWTINSTG